MANTGFPDFKLPRASLNIPREAMHWQFGEMEFGEMKRNTSNWSNFYMLLRRAGLTASAGLSCYYYEDDKKSMLRGMRSNKRRIVALAKSSRPV